MENQKTYCVYKHTNKLNNKCYIGITNSKPPSKRWGENGRRYRVSYKKENYKEGKFYNAILYYGWMNFEHEILEENLIKQEAEEMEIYYIDLYNSIENGYNDAYGYKGNQGKTWKWNISEERRKEISENQKGRKNNLGKTWKQNVTDERKKEIEYSVSKQIICDGKEFINVKYLSEYYNIPPSTLNNWLNNSFKYKNERRDYFLNNLGLRYKDEEKNKK